MQKKFLITFLLIIILFFCFAINSYASTEYTVYDEEKNNYYISFSFKEKTNFNIPDMTSHYSFSSPDIYFLLVETTSAYNFYTSLSPFVFVRSESSGNEVFKTSSGSYIYLTYYDFTTQVWKNKNLNSSNLTVSSSSTILMSSDDISNSNGEEIVYYKYVKSPLVRTVRKIEFKNSVTKEIVSILPVVLTIVVGFIGIRKAYNFTKKNLRNS